VLVPRPDSRNGDRGPPSPAADRAKPCVFSILGWARLSSAYASARISEGQRRRHRCLARGSGDRPTECRSPWRGPARHAARRRLAARPDWTRPWRTVRSGRVQPPYIEAGDKGGLIRGRRFEPPLALDAGWTALRPIGHVPASLGGLLAPGGPCCSSGGRPSHRRCRAFGRRRAYPGPPWKDLGGVARVAPAGNKELQSAELGLISVCPVRDLARAGINLGQPPLSTSSRDGARTRAGGAKKQHPFGVETRL